MIDDSVEKEMKATMKKNEIKAEKKTAEEPPKKKHAWKPPVIKAKPLYEKVMWSGVKPVYKCLQCNHFEDTKDDMILHILNHYPKAEKAKIMDRLIKEK